MNDDLTPVTPEPSDQQQPVVPPIAPPQPPAQSVAPSINDITRVQPRPVGPLSTSPAPQQPATTPPLASVPAAAPPEPLHPLPSEPAPPVSTADDPALQYQEEAEQSANMADTIKTVFWGFINWVAAPLLIVFILHNFVFQAYHVDGSSMAPTLATSDYMIISKVENTIAKLTGKKYIPRRHQVVVFSYPQDPSLIFIKRVIALPGERVVVKEGKITVYNAENPDGFSPDDDSFERSATYTEGDVDQVVPEGSIFVVGDNRLPSGSFDSREWGMLPSEDIIGNSVLRLLPLDGLRFFSDIPERIR
jgi:signal peptidase I